MLSFILFCDCCGHCSLQSVVCIVLRFMDLLIDTRWQCDWYIVIWQSTVVDYELSRYGRMLFLRTDCCVQTTQRKCLVRAPLCLRSSWCYICIKFFFAYILLFTFYWAEPGEIGPWPRWLTIILQCYDAVGWVTWPVKSSPKWPIICRVGR